MTTLDCPVCNGHACRRLELVDVVTQHQDYAPKDQQTQFALNAAAAETALQYQMFKCDGCSIEFSDPMRAPSAEWYHLAYRALDLFPADRWEFGEVLRRIQRGERLFEFGCGSGAFLERCKQAGAQVSGMDFSADAVASCIAKGLDVSQIDLNSMNGASSPLRFPHIAAFHFVEHIERPAALFVHAATRAEKGANLWLSVPSDRRPTRRMGLRDFLDQPPHHITRWTPEAFRELGERYGWRLVKMLYEPIALRTALWALTTYSPRYRWWEASGRFKNRIVEKAYRAGALPMALLRRLLKDRRMSGFTMLAHFVYEAR
jgi:2-polyprenyl-3-methyl-5-hydroxy-6-metoxy-1,4-benzoquinol methylase